MGLMTRQKPVDEAPGQQSAVPSPATETYLAHRAWLLALALVIATFAAYQPTWGADFIWDDDHPLTANPTQGLPDA
jgi:hypothetical protein